MQYYALKATYEIITAKVSFASSFQL